MGALGGVAADRQRGVEQKVEPVQRLFHPRAALGPDRAEIVAAVENMLHVVGDGRQPAARRRYREVHRPVDEEVLSHDFGFDIAGPGIGALGGGKALGIAARRQHPEGIDFRQARDQVAGAVFVDAEPVDFLEHARSIRVIGLAGLRRRRAGKGAIVLPRAAVGLPRHVGQGIQPVFGSQLHAVDRRVGIGLPLGVEGAGCIDIAVGRAVKLCGVALQRMGAELFDIDRRRGRQALRPKDVEPGRAAVGVGPCRQAVLGAGLVAGHQCRAVADRGVGAGKMGDPWFVGHAFGPVFRATTSTGRHWGGRSGRSCRTTGR